MAFSSSSFDARGESYIASINFIDTKKISKHRIFPTPLSPLLPTTEKQLLRTHVAAVAAPVHFGERPSLPWWRLLVSVPWGSRWVPSNFPE
eukprot:scaffold4600_cov169-Amphora_coffeaeformis.AAC.8